MSNSNLTVERLNARKSLPRDGKRTTCPACGHNENMTGRLKLTFELTDYQWSVVNAAMLAAFKAEPGCSPEEALAEICNQWLSAKEVARERGKCINAKGGAE